MKLSTRAALARVRARSCDDNGHSIMPRRSRLTPPSPPQTPGRALPHEHWSSQLVHTLGGSSSCYKHGYGEYIRNRSAGNVTWWNPSQGSSGSDWAALFLDSLVPQNTSVVLWEFAINDWWIRPAGISEANFHQQVLELFLRRLVHRQSLLASSCYGSRMHSSAGPNAHGTR